MDLPLNLTSKRFTVVARTLAGLAFDIDIRQEVHFDLDDPVTLAGLAAPTFDVKGKTAGFVPARLGLGQASEPIADRSECARIGRRIGSRRAPNGALINVDDLVEMLQPFDRLTWRRRLPRTIQVHRRGFEQRLNRQGRFAPPRNARHTNKLAQAGNPP